MKPPNADQCRRTTEMRWHLAQICAQLIGERECPEHPDLLEALAAVEADFAMEHHGPPSWEDLRNIMKGTLRACLEHLEEK